MRSRLRAPVALSVVIGAAMGCTPAPTAGSQGNPVSLMGAWRSTVQFASGPFAVVKDLEFLYVFNQGGTMTESSNYDAAPPVAPAYGSWASTQPGEFKATYVFFTTKPPSVFGDLSKGGGWLPAGSGTLTETIKLAPDGKSFESRIDMVMRDAAGRVVEGGGSAVGRGKRIEPQVRQSDATDK